MIFTIITLIISVFLLVNCVKFYTDSSYTLQSYLYFLLCLDELRISQWVFFFCSLMIRMQKLQSSAMHRLFKGVCHFNTLSCFVLTIEFKVLNKRLTQHKCNDPFITQMINRKTCYNHLKIIWLIDLWKHWVNFLYFQISQLITKIMHLLNITKFTVLVMTLQQQKKTYLNLFFSFKKCSKPTYKETEPP